MKSIVCFGDCNLDIIIPIEDLPVRGGCAFSSDMAFNMGGSVLNTAVALGRLKLQPSIASKIGNDMFGSMLKDFLYNNNVNIEYLIESDYHTGVAIGLVSPDGEKRWIAVRGNAADLHLTQEEINTLKLPDILYISGVELVEGRESRELAIHLARKVKENGGLVLLDPNIRVPSWRINDDVMAAFEEMYKYTDVFLPNEKELELLGKNQSLDETALSIINKGVSSIWLKLGSEGCAYYEAGRHYLLPGSKVKAVDTSGAGDAFNAAIIFGVVKGFTIEEMGSFANLFAGFTVTSFGTTQALPDYAEIERMIIKIKDSNNIINTPVA